MSLIPESKFQILVSVFQSSVSGFCFPCFRIALMRTQLGTSIKSCMGCLVMNHSFLFMKDSANGGKHWITKSLSHWQWLKAFLLFYSWLVM